MLVMGDPLLLASVKMDGLSELGWPTTVVAKVYKDGVSVTAPVAEDSNAPISHGPVGGRATPRASKQSAGIVAQVEVRFGPFCHALDPLFKS